MSVKVATLELELDKDNTEEMVKLLVTEVRPTWNVNHLDIQGGIGLLNKVVICKPSSDRDLPASDRDLPASDHDLPASDHDLPASDRDLPASDRDLPASDHDLPGIVIKTASEYWCGSMEENIQVWTFIEQHNLGPKLLALIKNGLCMEHVRGEMLGWNHPRLYTDIVYKSVAHQMAKYHQRKVLKAAQQEQVRTPHILYAHASQRYGQALDNPAMREHKEDFPSSEAVLNAERELRENLLGTGDLELAFCHMDINGSNIATSNQGAEFIDFDFTGISYSQIDIAWYFLTFMDPGKPGLDLVPDLEYEKKFLNHYLKVRERLEPEFKYPNVQILLSQVEKAKLFIHLRFIVSGPTLLDHSGFDGFVEFSKSLWKNYPEVYRRTMSL